MAAASGENQTDVSGTTGAVSRTCSQIGGFKRYIQRTSLARYGTPTVAEYVRIRNYRQSVGA
jgi:hypothetical protein